MRKYNFGVRFIKPTSFGVLCRVGFNRRFDARDMIDDFLKNVADNYLNRLLRPQSAATYTYSIADDNSVDIVMPQGTRSTSDGERAILLNLIDFGQDFEAERSTTIDVVEFPVGDPRSYTVERLLAALKAENDGARTSMDDLMRHYPNEDEDAAAGWPSADHGHYYYQIRLEFDGDINPIDTSAFNDFVEALQEVNMRNGYSVDTSAKEAVQSGRTGLSYEIEVRPRLISYLVERPACDPALSIVWLWRTAEQKFGRPTENSEIFVTAAD